MSMYRIEYLPKPGLDVKMFRQGFNSVEAAERTARTNLRTAVFANVVQGQRLVKRLWEKEVCINYRDERSPYRCLQVFDSKEDLAKHVQAHHAYRPKAPADITVEHHER